VTPPKEIVRQVRERARGRCEYCRMHESLQGATFHAEHVAPRSRGGEATVENLAWACPGCNLAKADRAEAVDPETGLAAALFNPRKDVWSQNFRWEGHEVVALTPVGRATVGALDLNRPRRLLIRQAEQIFGLFPPRS